MIEKDKEVLQIEEKFKDDLDAVYERIHVQVEQNIVKQAQLRKKRQQLTYKMASIAVALVLVVTLSIVLPIVLQPDDNTVLRYNDTNLAYEDVEYTLKEYVESLGEEVLYLDWYETADECITTRYYDVNNAETTVYIKEILFNEGYRVELSVLKNNDNIIVETFDSEWFEAKNTTIHNVSMTYLLNINSCNVKFEYEGYKYYLSFLNTANMDFITATIESMFNN